MVCVVMRHARRQSGVDEPLIGYNYTDPDGSCPEIWQSVRRLIKQGLPMKQIITSPYLRTRQTALLVQYSYLKLTGNYLPIIVDLRLGEFSHRHCRMFTPRAKDFDADTSLHYRNHVPLCRESPEAFVQRVTQFHSRLPSETIAITHYGVADLLGKLSGRDIKLQEGRYEVLSTSEERQLINSPQS